MHLGRTTLSKFLIQQLHRHPRRPATSGALLVDVAAAVQGDLRHDRQGGARGLPRRARRHATCRARPSRSSTCWRTRSMIRSCEWGGLLAGMASEELEEPYAVPPELRARPLPAGVRSARWLLQHRRQRLGRHDLLGAAARSRASAPCSRRLPAAGTASRSPPATPSTGRRRCSCITVGKGTHGFTLDREIGNFILTHPDLQIPRRHQRVRDQHQQRALLGAAGAPLRRPNARPARAGVRAAISTCAGSPRMVAEVHRILMRGGVFMYPRDTKDRSRPGRLRLLYEANPISLLVEQAGGRATHRPPAPDGGDARGAAPARPADPRLAQRGRTHRALSRRMGLRRRPAVQLAALQRALAVSARGAL